MHHYCVEELLDYGAMHCIAHKKIKKNRAYSKQNKQKISIAQKARYYLTEPKADKKELYVQNLKKSISSQSALRKKLLRAFKVSRQPLAEKIKESKLAKAVLNIASRKLLHSALKLRKQSAGELLKCIRSVNALTMTATDFGESCHTASSEPFFYDQSYRLVKHTSPIAVDDSGRCVIAEEVGQRDSKTERPLKWKCTAECKLPTSNEAQCIVAVKALFEEPVHKLREALNRIDECTEHGHYTRMLSINTPKPYYELAGHPLPCATVNSNCKSRLRILRAAATHFPLLRRLVVLLYEAIRLHRLLDNIDTGLCAGDFKKLVRICDIENYKVLFSANSISADAVSVDAVADDTDLPIGLQKPNLPDLESELHVQYAAIICEVEKKFADDAEFPCCSCERLLLRKQVTAFKLSNAKFNSEKWKSLKRHILQNNSDAASQTHYVCQYCRPVLNKDKMPSRCILNGLFTEPMPKELEALDPLSKQLIQRGKAFQAVVRLGTHTGKVPTYNSLKACKGTMFFLPLPLDKTLQTIEDVENSKDVDSVGLPDPELYILVSGKPEHNA